MGQLQISGDGAHDYLQARLSNDLDKAGDGDAQYTLLTNEQGGIVDDLIAYRRGTDDYLLVVNASNVEPITRRSRRRRTSPPTLRCSPSRGRRLSRGSASMMAPLHLPRG